MTRRGCGGSWRGERARVATARETWRERNFRLAGASSSSLLVSPPIVLDSPRPRRTKSEHGTKRHPLGSAQGGFCATSAPHLLGIHTFTDAKFLSLALPDHRGRRAAHGGEACLAAQAVLLGHVFFTWTPCFGPSSLLRAESPSSGGNVLSQVSTLAGPSKQELCLYIARGDIRGGWEYRCGTNSTS